MSLVHQVLKDIDQRKDAPGVVVPQALQMAAENNNNSNKWVLISVAAAIVLVLLGWFFWPQQENVKPAASDIATKLSQAIDTEQNSVEVVSNRKQALAEFPETEVTAPQVKKLAEQQVKTTPVIERSIEEGSHLEISRRDQKHQQLYVDILSDMKAQQWQRALDSSEKLRTEPGLSVELKQKLLHNQLRIYLELNRFTEFLDFYQQHQHQNSVAWLSTAAPGLHMIGSYQDAIESYKKLIVEQPAVSNWPIAMALALEQNQQHQEAEQTLQGLLRRYPLQPQQRAWVEQKLASLR